MNKLFTDVKLQIVSSYTTSRSKRRYQAYLDWCECYDGTFKDFLDWLKITAKDELFIQKSVKLSENLR